MVNEFEIKNLGIIIIMKIFIFKVEKILKDFLIKIVINYHLPNHPDDENQIRI